MELAGPTDIRMIEIIMALDLLESENPQLQLEGILVVRDAIDAGLEIISGA